MCAISSQFAVNAQRSIDLQLEITSHQSGEVFEFNEIANIITKITNLGTETFGNSDTLCYYQIINGDTVPMTMLNLNFTPYVNNSAAVTDYFNITRPVVFSNGFGGAIFDLCIYILPKNSVNPIVDPDLANNIHCISVSVSDENLTIKEEVLSKINVFPNPANNSFTIDSNSSLAIFDSRGNAIPFTQIGTEIRCSNWENGLYFIQISTDSGVQIQKMLVSH